MTAHTLKHMVGQSVIAVDTAEEVGRVKHFVLSPDASRIVRLHIDGRKKHAVFAEWADLESFGADRVMVRAADAATESTDDRDVDTAKGVFDLIGSRVLDTAGFEHGDVSDATFDSDTGEMIDVTTTGGERFTAAQLRSLGSYALVVDA